MKHFPLCHKIMKETICYSIVVNPTYVQSQLTANCHHSSLKLCTVSFHFDTKLSIFSPLPPSSFKCLRSFPPNTFQQYVDKMARTKTSICPMQECWFTHVTCSPSSSLCICGSCSFPRKPPGQELSAAQPRGMRSQNDKIR